MSKNKTNITAEPGKLEIIITREFDAPRELVFQAYTDPDIYPRWLGPRDLTTVLETFEPRSGGSWRYTSTDAAGNRYGFHGVYHDVTAPERMISTFEFDGLPESGHVVLDTARFETLPNNRSRIITQSIFQSVADRDAMIQAGMERGVNDGFERLDELVAQPVA